MLSNKQLKAIFGGDKESPAHEAFQKNWKPSVGDEVLYGNKECIVVQHNDNTLYVTLITKKYGAEIGVGKLVSIKDLTFIPSVEPQLREMSGLNWIKFGRKCKIQAEYFIRREYIKLYPSEKERWDNALELGNIIDSSYEVTERVSWLLAAAMVVMKGYKWQGFEKGWVKDGD